MCPFGVLRGGYTVSYFMGSFLIPIECSYSVGIALS